MSPSDPTSAAFPTAAELVDRVPLIKNPAFWVPPPVQVPLDIHPLPDDVQAYFVYPHTLEAHVLATLPLERTHLEQQRAERRALLESYAQSKERARKAKLNQIAPGWNEGVGGVIEPVRKAVPTTTTTTTTATGATRAEEEGEGESSAEPLTVLRASPTEMGPQTLDALERDQIQGWLDKWDRGDSSGAGAGAGAGGAGAERVDKLI
ncbi:hypothetical protein JCM11491_004395 [Sporobolomyces phaffii]